MTSATTLLRSLLVYGLCLPLAIFLGYLLATPLDPTTFAAVGLVLFILILPLLLRWHHLWLIASWNMSAVIFFMPGHPQFWMAMAAMSLLISVLQYTLNRERRFLSVPSVTWPLLLLAVVVVITAKLTGGVGIKSLGSEFYGGKRYFMILASIMGYFAFVGRRIPPERAVLYTVIFFLGGSTMAVGNLAGMISPSFNFLFLIFPVENLSDLNTAVVGRTGAIMRSGGLGMMSTGVFCALLAKYNLRGVIDIRNPLKALALVAFMFIGLLGGFRSILIMFLLSMAILFCLEGLLKSRWLPVLAVALIIGATGLGGFATRLPLSVQRTLAVLPIDIDPVVKMDAYYSTQWRLKMWREVIPEIPNYLLLGKGYGFNAVDADIAYMTSREGLEGTELAGDYHNGPLSVILPLGIFGAFAFLWFLASSLRLMYLNYKYGDPAIQRINTFLFAYYLARVIFFCTVFGAFYMDLASLVGMVGLSVALNGGVAKPASAVEPVPEVKGFRISPSVSHSMGI